MMRGLQSLDLSVVLTAFYALAGTLFIVSVIGWVAYRRACKNGRWSRLMGTGYGATPVGPRRELERLRRRLDEAQVTARVALDAVVSGGARLGDLDLTLGRLECLADHLSAQLEQLDAGGNSRGLARIVPLLTERVEDVEQLAGAFIDAVGQAISRATEHELTETAAELANSLRILDYRALAFRQLSAHSTTPIDHDAAAARTA